MSEIFLDIETTGLSFQDKHKIVEIACVETKDLIPTKKVFHSLNPRLIATKPRNTYLNQNSQISAKVNV